MDTTARLAPSFVPPAAVVLRSEILWAGVVCVTPRGPERPSADPIPDNGEIRAYWDLRIHDTVLSDDPPGTLGFFGAMDAYRYGRLDYLPDLVDFEHWRGRDVLDLGCGAGLDLVRFARAGARAVGVELSPRALAMARNYLAVSGLDATLVQADAARLPIPDASFDLVFCHGVLSFVRDENAVVAEIRRVLRPDGIAILGVYHRYSWIYAAHKLFGLPLGHADAPGFRIHTMGEFAKLVAPLEPAEIFCERLPRPVNGRGPAGLMFNTFVRALRGVLPKPWFRLLGWHLIARCGAPATNTPRARQGSSGSGWMQGEP
jgi:SAM-dependent methyltransferase